MDTCSSHRPLIVRVVVWSSNVPNIFVSSQPHVGFSAQDTAAVGKLTHYVRGQDIALLSGNRAVTDADGVATWEALTIEAASSRFVYLNFYCDGVIASWNNPDLRPPISGQLLPPPAFVPPLLTKMIRCLGGRAFGSMPSPLSQ